MAPTIRSMFLAVLICSDEECDNTFEEIGSLEELDRVLCDCGYLMQVVAVEGTAEPEAEVVALWPAATLELAA
jgi:hypothetical protein